MDLYPNLRKILTREFSSLNEFARQAGIPESTLKRFMVGDFGAEAELNTREKVEAALLHLRPELPDQEIWMRKAPPSMLSEVVESGGRRWEMVTMIRQTIRDLGPAAGAERSAPNAERERQP